MRVGLFVAMTRGNTPPHSATACNQRRKAAGEKIMSKMTRGEVQDLLSKFATENPKYRQALLANPKATIERQLNTSLGNVQVKAIAETSDTVYVVVPYVPTSGELSDADLETVAGGFKDIDAQCQSAGGGIGASVNTVVQINA
jgi:hypothetical protein